MKYDYVRADTSAHSEMCVHARTFPHVRTSGSTLPDAPICRGGEIGYTLWIQNPLSKDVRVQVPPPALLMRSNICAGGAKRLHALRRDLKAGAMFGQQTKPRGGVATEPSDDEARVVTESLPDYIRKTLRNMRSALTTRFCQPDPCPALGYRLPVPTTPDTPCPGSARRTAPPGACDRSPSQCVRYCYRSLP